MIQARRVIRLQRGAGLEASPGVIAEGVFERFCIRDMRVPLGRLRGLRQESDSSYDNIL